MEQNNNFNQQQTGTPTPTPTSTQQQPTQNYSQPQNGGYYQQQGQAGQGYQQQPGQNYQYQQQYYAAPTPQATPDALENRGLAAICYLGPAFQILALVANGKSAFVRHHANQGLALDILTLLSALMVIIPILGAIAYGIFSIVLLVFRIMGILNARKYKNSVLPICGEWKFIR